MHIVVDDEVLLLDGRSAGPVWDGAASKLYGKCRSERILRIIGEWNAPERVVQHVRVCRIQNCQRGDFLQEGCALRCRKRLNVVTACALTIHELLDLEQLRLHTLGAHCLSQ